jgi:site-specific DNA-methyltransferase (adenine-specific)
MPRLKRQTIPEQPAPEKEFFPERAGETLCFLSDDRNLAIVREDFIGSTVLDQKSVDLLITSPPYNVGINYGSTEDGITYPEYLEFSRQWLSRAYDLMKPDGRMCLNIPLDKNKGGQQSIYADLTTLAKNAGWQYHATIIWNEGNISRRTAWGSFASASAPYVIAPVETIVVFYKETWKKQRQGISDITKEEFIDWTNGLWTFSGEKRRRTAHPAPFPVELPRRCIRLFSYRDDLVLDPFLGSGTTLAACRELGRRGIGFEIDPGYCKSAAERLTR